MYFERPRLPTREAALSVDTLTKSSTPVALAAYTASAIARSGVMQSGLAAFRFALIGFALPYCFVLNPELLLLAEDGGAPALSAIFAAVACTLLGIVPLAGGVTGQLRGNLHPLLRLLLLAASGLLLFARNTPSAWVGCDLIQRRVFRALHVGRRRLRARAVAQGRLSAVYANCSAAMRSIPSMACSLYAGSVGAARSLARRCQLNLASPLSRARCSSDRVVRKSGSGS